MHNVLQKKRGWGMERIATKSITERLKELQEFDASAQIIYTYEDEVTPLRISLLEARVTELERLVSALQRGAAVNTELPQDTD